MKDSDEIIERAQAASDKAELHRWDYEERRHFNILHPSKPEAKQREVPEVVTKVTDDALIEQPVDDDVLAKLMPILGEEVGIMHRELEQRIEAIEKHLGLSNIVYKVTNN